MRNCGNCYDGHYNLSDRGEEMYCDETGYSEEDVSVEEGCEWHRFIPGCEEEKNYILYDESYLGPGFFVINENKEGQIQKWLKIYPVNAGGFTSYSIRAFSVDGRDKPNEEFNTFHFTFRDIEDEENGLYEAFTNLCVRLNGSKVETIDKFSQGRNHFCLKENGKVTTFSISKDIYGIKEPSNFIDIYIGDYFTCENWDAVSRFYVDLAVPYSSKLQKTVKPQKVTEEDIKRLLFTHLK